MSDSDKLIWWACSSTLKITQASEANMLGYQRDSSLLLILVEEHNWECIIHPKDNEIDYILGVHMVAIKEVYLHI